jgi:hypothetical protein
MQRCAPHEAPDGVCFDALIEPPGDLPYGLPYNVAINKSKGANLDRIWSAPCSFENQKIVRSSHIGDQMADQFLVARGAVRSR